MRLADDRHEFVDRTRFDQILGGSADLEPGVGGQRNVTTRNV
jgi:hypothetical protein